MLEPTQAIAPVEIEPNLTAPLTEAPQATRRRRLLRAMLALTAPLAAALVIWLLALPARAAVVFEYFNVVPSSSAVLLEWSTLSEYNLRGFEVLCKLQGEPEAAYHRIAFFNPKGNATNGAQYDLLVTDLKPGQPYCFRLVELTTDETPGEERERCGYGLSITPTPTLRATVAPTITTGITPTIVLFPTGTPFGFVPTPDPFATATPTFAFPQSPLPTPTPFVTPLGFATTDPALLAAQAGTPAVDPFAAPTLDPFATPTTDPFATATWTPDPFATPTGAPTPTLDPFATATWTPDPFATPTWTPDPFATATWTPDPFLAATATAAALATETATLTPTATLTATSDAAGRGGAELAAAVFPSPTSLYEIQTATPVPPVAALAPAVTPWPTATPPTSLLQGMLAPTAQNITVLLLCFIFLSASVLGGLGLITSVLWMRARSQRDMDELRWRARRRI